MAKRSVRDLENAGLIAHTWVNSDAGQIVEAVLRENTYDLIDRIVWDESFTKVALFYKGLPETSVFSYALPTDWKSNLQAGKELIFTPDNWYNEHLAASEPLVEVR